MIACFSDAHSIPSYTLALSAQPGVDQSNTELYPGYKSDWPSQAAEDAAAIAAEGPLGERSAAIAASVAAAAGPNGTYAHYNLDWP